MTHTGYFIGIMTGTSVDAVDTALIRINENGTPTFDSGYAHPIDNSLRQRILSCSRGEDDRLDTLATLDLELASIYSYCVEQLLNNVQVSTKQIVAIGSHGQTIRHCPECTPPYTVQLGNGDLLAQNSGITTVSNFRQRDIALGGQGAPLAPLFHHQLFHQEGKTVIVANLGGIANISILTTDGLISGCDTGPANTLMDQWIFHHKQQRYDKNAQWAKTGTMNAQLLEKLLNEPWLHQIPPKSTGPELFNLQWLNQNLKGMDVSPEDVQRTLCEFTAITLTQAITDYSEHAPDKLILCGGGASNPLLVEHIKSLVQFPVEPASDYGIEPDWIEATMFAWLAYRTLNGLPGNVPAVTGATEASVLGMIHPANKTS